MIEEAQATVGGTSELLASLFSYIDVMILQLNNGKDLASYYEYCYELGFLPKPVQIWHMVR